MQSASSIRKLPACPLGTGLLLLSMLPLWAQSVPNSSFEENSFSVFPGYISSQPLDPVPQINGWTAFPETGVGLNPSAGSPFADNGTIPAGSQVAFLQAGASGASSLETTISGLTTGVEYQVTLRVNARNGNEPRLNLYVDNNLLVDSTVRAVGAANPYTWVTGQFTAGDTTALLNVTNARPDGDHTLVIDDVKVAPYAASWVQEAWTDVTTMGIDPAYLYTHAYNFGSTAGGVVGELVFTGTTGGNPAVAGKFAVAGLGAVFANDPNNIVDTGRVLANDFIYNGFPGTITVEGLTPGKDYVFTLYSMGWEGPTARWATFQAGGKRLTADQDAYDNNNGVRLVHSYTADASGTLVVTTTPLQNASIHCYGFTNREATPLANTAPAFSAQPAAKSGFIGDTVRFVAAATGTRPMSYQWYKGDSPVPGATSNILELTVASAADAAFYSLKATNAHGDATSTPVFLKVFEEVPGLLYSTGLDATGVPLLDGEVDTHYKLVENPDTFVEDAIVQDSTVFPIVAGPWLANSDTSKWIGPQFNTTGSAGPDPTTYVYRTVFDLTGRAPEVTITGGWATDNLGTAILINGVAAPGAVASGGFGGLTTFTLNTALLPAGTVTAGPNNLDFIVVNQGAGYTGLRTDNLRVTSVPANILPVIISQPSDQGVTSGQAVTLSADAWGSPVLNYQWTLDGVDIPGANNPVYAISSFTHDKAGRYNVRVSNTVGSVLSTNAIITALDIPATAGPLSGGTIGTGDSFTFTAVPDGSPPFSYQWNLNGSPIEDAVGSTYTIASATHDDDGSYTVTISNAFGNDTSDPAILTVRETIPGLFNSGVDSTGILLGDGEYDNHYTLVVNPDGLGGEAAVVEDTNSWPILAPAGPWLATSETSKWIGPQFNTGASAGAASLVPGEGGTYVYRMVLDLTGFDPGSVYITGSWTSDNAGVGIFVNDTATGNTQDGNFGALHPFTIDASTLPEGTFIAGLNNIDFQVNNASVGPTGLRVEGIKGLADPSTAVAALPVDIGLSAGGNPVIEFTGVEGTQYHILRSTSLTTGSWTDLGTITAPAGGAVQFEDTTAPVGRAFYEVQYPLP